MSVLPIGGCMKGRLALDASLAEQMKQAPNEAGVREQLSRGRHALSRN
jgi:hypothetical protein